MSDKNISGKFYEIKYFDVGIPAETFTSIDHVSGVGFLKANEQYFIERNFGINMNLILMTVSGKGKIKIGNIELNAYPGTAIIIPKNHFHHYKCAQNSGWEFYWIHYSGVYSDACTTDIIRNNQLLFDVGLEKIHSLFKPFETECFNSAEREFENFHLLFNILQTLLHKSIFFNSEIKEKNLIDKILIEIESSTNSDFSLDILSNKLHYSKEHLIRIFKKSTGMTPYRYYRSLLFKQACITLESTDLSVSQIAEKFRYTNPENFSKQFKAFVGVSPAEYRKAEKSKPSSKTYKN